MQYTRDFKTDPCVMQHAIHKGFQNRDVNRSNKTCNLSDVSLLQLKNSNEPRLKQILAWINADIIHCLLQWGHKTFFFNKKG